LDPFPVAVGGEDDNGNVSLERIASLFRAQFPDECLTIHLRHLPVEQDAGDAIAEEIEATLIGLQHFKSVFAIIGRYRLIETGFVDDLHDKIGLDPVVFHHQYHGLGRHAEATFSPWTRVPEAAGSCASSPTRSGTRGSVPARCRSALRMAG